MPSINPRARSREDRAGDPLDGMVNLFDLGIVLALGFMIAALAALDLNLGQISGEGDPVVVPPGSVAEDVEIPEGSEIIGRGRTYGTVYQLEDGQLVLVTPEGQQPLDGSTTNPSLPTDPNSTTPDSSGTDQGSSTPPSTGGTSPTTPQTTPQSTTPQSGTQPFSANPQPRTAF